MNHTFSVLPSPEGITFRLMYGFLFHSSLWVTTSAIFGKSAGHSQFTSATPTYPSSLSTNCFKDNSNKAVVLFKMLGGVHTAYSIPYSFHECHVRDSYKSSSLAFCLWRSGHFKHAFCPWTWTLRGGGNACLSKLMLPYQATILGTTTESTIMKFGTYVVEGFLYILIFRDYCLWL